MRCLYIQHAMMRRKSPKGVLIWKMGQRHRGDVEYGIHPGIIRVLAILFHFRYIRQPLLSCPQV